MLARPEVEDGLGGALAEVRVVDGAAADAATLQNADCHVLGRSSAHVLEELREHVVLALVEIGGRRPRAFLERDGVEPGARQLAQSDRAAGTRADDDRIDLEGQVAREVAPAEHRAAHCHPSRGRPIIGPS